jgi:hypothetical protein
MSRHYLDQPRLLVNKALLGIVQPEAHRRLLLVEMAYFAAIYVSFYSCGIRNPLIVFGLNIRTSPLFGFDTVHTSVGLFACAGINAPVFCPASTSDYPFAVLSSYLSAFVIPKLSLTYFLVTLNFAEVVFPKVRGPFFHLISGLRKINTYS